MSKGRLLGVWAILSTLAYIFASQDWFTLSMAPNGDTVQLASYNGLTAYGNLSPILMLNFAAILAVAYVGSLGRKITTGLVLALNATLIATTFIGVQSQDISGLSKQVEQMTGIAAAHGIKDVTVVTGWATAGFLITLALKVLLIAFVLASERRWPKRPVKTERTSKETKTTEPKDSIGIWDSQR
ncbi:MAG: hypothetical protein RJA66_849 [Actinomycetota bacterium]|jgi:uncharacterized membrane protein (TIGR02234 family)